MDHFKCNYVPDGTTASWLGIRHWGKYDNPQPFSIYVNKLTEEQKDKTRGNDYDKHNHQSKHVL